MPRRFGSLGWRKSSRDGPTGFTQKGLSRIHNVTHLQSWSHSVPGKSVSPATLEGELNSETDENGSA